MSKKFDPVIQSLTLAQLVADGLICYATLMLATLSAHADGLLTQVPTGTLPMALNSTMLAMVFAIVMVLMFSFAGLYRRSVVTVGLGVLLGRSVVVVGMGAVVAWLLLIQSGMALADGVWGRLLSFFVWMLLGVLLIRVSAYVARRHALGAPRVLIIGAGLEARHVAGDIAKGRGVARTVVGFYPTDEERAVLANPQQLSRPRASLMQVVKQLRVDELIVAVREQRGGVLPMDQLLGCRVSGVPVLDLAGFYEETRGEVPIDSLKASWLVYGDGFYQSAWRQAFKRVFDLVFASLLLALSLPVLLLAALAVRLEDGGPVIYRQERVGLGGQTFTCIKLRSMGVDAEKDGVARWASKSDARVTRVGAFLRKTRIDELPQLICVLNGDMSLVGPRPERPNFVASLRQQMPFYDLRHSVKPGITGWAQVRFTYGSSIEDARRKHQFDLYYVKNHSVLLDLQILLETVSVVLFREGAQ
jgi:sugar transferase (PEP-CTERM system associated)